MDTITIRYTTAGYTPTKAHTHDAGIDIPAQEHITLQPLQRHLVCTGIHIALPVGCVGQICPRSGNAHTYGITVLNAPGIIDAGYRGEIKVNLINLGDTPVEIQPGDHIAQLLVLPVVSPVMAQVTALPVSSDNRGMSGHGSSGNITGVV